MVPGWDGYVLKVRIVLTHTRVIGVLLEIFPPGYTLARGFREHVAVLGGRWCGVRGRLTPKCLLDTDRNAQPQIRAFDNFDLDHKAVSGALMS